MLTEYKKESFKYAEKIGLCSALTEYEINKGYGFICREGWARRVGKAVIAQLNPKIKVIEMPLHNGYDQEFMSGGTLIKMENKCRSYDRPFDICYISPSKEDFIAGGEGFILEYYDKLRKWWIWDLEKYTPKFKEKCYRHKKWTAEHKDNYWVIEDAYCFDRSKATLSGKL